MLQHDRVKAAFFGAVKAADPRVDFRATWSGVVVHQAADLLAVDVVTDDKRMPGMSGLPLRIGIPGVRLKLRVAEGAVPSPSPADPVVVLVSFENGDPARPIAHLVDAPANAIESISIAANTLVELGGASLTPIVDGVVQGQAIDSFLGLPLWMLGSSSATVAAKK